MLDDARFTARTAGLVSLTLGMYGLLEVETALTDRAEHQAVLQKWIHRYGKSLLRLYGVEVTARGPGLLPGERCAATDARGMGRIFVMNHRSGLDIPLTLAFVEATILSRADVAEWPLLGMAARRVGTLFVDRDSKHSGAAAVDAMADAVTRGIAVMVYPEGTTFAGDEVRPFKLGAFRTAERTGAEIVPLGVCYGGQDVAYLDESFALHLKRVSSTRRTRAALAFGEPLRGGGDADALAERAHDAVQSLVVTARSWLGEG